MSSEYERKCIILGKTGNGKSSLGNVLLGRQAFDQAHGFTAVTMESKLERVDGRVSVVDTPGLFDADGERCLVEQALEIQKAIQICPNPHVFLIVLNGSSRLTQEDLSSVDVFRIIFGGKFLEKAIIVLTHIENNISDTVLGEMLAKSCEMSRLIKQCGDRFARIDNTDPNPEHTKHIIRLVDEVSGTGKDSFKNEYIHVHIQVLQKELENHAGGPAALEQIRLAEQIKTNAEEEREFQKKCWKVAAGVCVLCGMATVTYCRGGATTAAAGILQSMEWTLGVESWSGAWSENLERPWSLIWSEILESN